MRLGAAGYLIATGVQAAGTLVFLSLATRILGVEQYGRWALLEPLLLLGGPVAAMGLSAGVIKLIAQDGLGAMAVLRMVGRNALIAAIVVGGIASALIGHFLQLGVYTWLVFVILVAEARYVLLINVLRGAGRSWQYASVVAGRVFTSIALLALIYFTGWGDRFDGRSIALVWLSALLFALLLSHVSLWRRKSAEPEPMDSSDGAAAYKTAVSYGVPLLGATILSALLANSDRYVLAAHVAATDLSQYVLAGKVAAVMNLCVTPLNLWWPAVRFRHMKDEDGGQRYFADANLLVCSALTIIAAGVYSLGPWLLSIFAPQAHYDLLVTGLLCLSALFIALSVPLNVGGLKPGKTHWVTIAIALASVAQIGLLIVLIPMLGLTGAALATTVSAALSLGFQNFMSQRIHPVPFRYGYMLLTVAAWATGSVMLAQSALSLPAKVACLLGGVAIHGLLLVRSSSWQLVRGT